MEESLKIDFFESGVGETIRITFPDGGLGIVDAHPTTSGGRLPISDLVDGRKIHFVCLTHPHADHGIDLVPILRDHPEIGEFWHTLSDVDVFVFAEGGQIPNYRSPIRDVVTEFQRHWGRFLTEIYGHVGLRKLPYHKLRSDLESTEIAGVSIHVLSPEEQQQNRFTAAYQEIARGDRKGFPDPNLLSAVLALEYGGAVVLLGADAKTKNWDAAIKKYRRLKLSPSVVLKVPHHGAANALELHKRKNSYLDLCSREAVAVLFAGDVHHPEPRVDKKLRSRTNLACLVNRLHSSAAPSDPLGINLPGAVAVAQPVSPCQSQLSFEIQRDGSVRQTAGHLCDTCQFCPS